MKRALTALAFVWLALGFSTVSCDAAGPVSLDAGGSAAAPSPPKIKFYVRPNTDAAEAVIALTRSGDVHDASLIRKIARTPQAIWVGAWNSDNGTVVNQTLTEARGAVPVFVLYAIPDLDCGGYSAGGYATDAQYERFVNQIAAAVKGRQAWFVVEPDALPEENDCGLSKRGIAERNRLIRYASRTLSAVSSHVYLDAGGSYAVSVSYIAPILKVAGVSFDRGFSLNVSNFYPTSSEESYGNQLSALVGAKHFVIDTSRNGNRTPPADDAWCNPPGRRLGVTPTTSTNDPLADAYLWIKSPGQSDGNCKPGQPESGDWYQAYALALVGD